ncbi:MAG: NADPH:quinone oxidoreductase family protein [Myxococcota bacterium]|jgi:NADPH2:quinone reductase
MKAVLCREHGPPESLVVADLPDPEAAEGQVVIDVRACGVNFPDVLVIENKYQFKPPLPFSPGAEVAGIVSECGAGVKGFAIGDRVLGSCGMGGFVERIAVPERAAIKIPDAMSFDEAAAFLMTYGTSHYALADRGALKAGETLLVLGAAGGVGLAAVELGKTLGARVIAAASSPEKLAVCSDHGADEVIDYEKEDLRKRIKELTDGHGVDVLYDPVGGDYAEPALRSMAWGGRYLVIGFAAGEIPRLPLNLTLLKGCSIVGVFWGSFTARDPKRHLQYVAELMQLYEAGKLRPHISARYSFDEVALALRDLAERRARGKILLIPPSAG